MRGIRRRYASMTAQEAGARSAWTGSSTLTNARKARVRNAGDHRCENDRQKKRSQPGLERRAFFGMTVGFIWKLRCDQGVKD